MHRRVLPVLLVVVLVAVFVTACGKACNNLGGTNGIRVDVPAAIGKVAKTWRLELCQGEHCASVNFPSAPTQGSGVAPGIRLVDEGYEIDLKELGKGWKADTTSAVTVIGFATSGRTVVRGTETFEFDASYPNGPDCDKTPFLRHTTGVDGGDLVG